MAFSYCAKSALGSPPERTLVFVSRLGAERAHRSERAASVAGEAADYSFDFMDSTEPKTSCASLWEWVKPCRRSSSTVSIAR